MRFIRLEIHDEKGYSSTPYLFCSQCKSFMPMAYWYIRFCPWCGHKYEEKQVEIISVDESELTEKGIGFEIEDIADYVREKVKWDD